MSSTRQLFELAGADDRVRFSPYCWRIRLALAHKGLPVETPPWRFTDKEAIAASGQGKVPVLVDGERWISDSWTIAEYLEQQYPETPSLFGSAEGQALARFINQWTNDVLHPAIAGVILPEIFQILHEKDQDYFRHTRETAFGATLETLAEQQETALISLYQILKPLHHTLALQPYLAGEAPNFADYIVFGAFQWARLVSDSIKLPAEEPIGLWIERMLDAYDGLARKAPKAYED